MESHEVSGEGALLFPDQPSVVIRSLPGDVSRQKEEPCSGGGRCHLPQHGVFTVFGQGHTQGHREGNHGQGGGGSQSPQVILSLAVYVPPLKSEPLVPRGLWLIFTERYLFQAICVGLPCCAQW